MNIEDERKRFEAWARQGQWAIHRNGGEQYVNTATEHAWRGWLARAEAEGWRPIESAPRDGSRIMLGYKPDEDHEFGFVGQGRWWPSDDDGPDNMGHDAGFMDCNFEFFQCGRSFGHPDYMGHGLQPTHWQPLPAPPKEDGE